MLLEEALLHPHLPYCFLAATGVTGAVLFFATVFLVALCFLLVWATFLAPVVFLDAELVLFAAGFGVALVCAAIAEPANKSIPEVRFNRPQLLGRGESLTTA